MIEPQANIILIGMAGSGTSSIGLLLAKTMSRYFIDTDKLIEETAGGSLQEILEAKGLSGFRLLEENILLSLNPANHVIATGGSSVYSKRGMLHLKKNGVVIFLDVKLSLLRTRIRNFSNRGLVKHPKQSFGELYSERMPLYRKYADYIFNCGKMNEEEICTGLVSLLRDKL
jgi:shikimate kinase